MDQLHEELKEPVVATAAALTEARDSDSSDSDEKREGDRSPSEDEFLSCDSSSDRGEGDGQGRSGGGSQAEAELLMADEAGRAISEKERMKDRKFPWGQQRTSSEQVDEDADVDTAMAALEQQPPEAERPSPRSTSPCRTPGASQRGEPRPVGPQPYPGGLRQERICLQCRRPGLIPESGRSPGEGNGNPLQYPRLESPMDRGAWRATVHGGRKELDTTERLAFGGCSPSRPGLWVNSQVNSMSLG